MEHILTHGASPLHKHPVLQHPFLNSASIQLPFCTTALFATPICTFYGGSRFLLAMATPKLSFFRYVKVKCVDFSGRRHSVQMSLACVLSLAIADLQISKSPMGPTKNLERHYNRVVGRSVGRNAGPSWV